MNKRASARWIKGMGGHCSETLRPRVRSLGVTVGGAPGKYKHGSKPPTWTEGDPGERVVVYWWYRELIETRGHQIEKSSSRELETRLFLHARRPQQCTPPRVDQATKRTWFNEARAPHPIHRCPSPRLIIIFYYFFLYRTQS